MTTGVTDELIGAKLGNIEIQRKLGSGGMGAVYLGRHLGLEKPVAVKVLSGVALSDPEFTERFLREAKTAARLEHPGIVQVFDVGETGGRYFIAMQYVDGRSLDAILKEKGKLPVASATSIVKRVASALGAAHKAGIVHRDIKPANILVSKDGHVKVADFGLARTMASGQTISKTGDILGTPHYMAPEQAEGRAVDGRTDLYALGATYYHLVTGRPCFQGTTPLAVVLKQIKDHAEPAHQVDPAIPERVSAVISKLMEKDPAARFQTAADVIAALDGLAAAPVPTAVDAVAPRRLRTGWILGVFAGAVCLAVILGVAMGGGTVPTPEVVPPPLPRVEPPAPAPQPPAIVQGAEEALKGLRDVQKIQAREVYGRLESLMRAIQEKDEPGVEAFLCATPGKRKEAARDAVLRELWEKLGKSQWDAVEVLRYQPPMADRGWMCGLEIVPVRVRDGVKVSGDQVSLAWMRQNEQWSIFPRPPK